MVTIQNGSIDDFFDSAINSAKQIDKNEKVTPKHTIWMETSDLLDILKPARTQLISYLRGKTKIYYSSLLKELHKSPSSLNKDLEILLKLELIDIQKETNPGHGTKKVIKPLFQDEELEFKAKVA